MEIRLIPIGQTGVDPARMADWEQATGQRLPDAYKQMMAQVDGGFPYPNIAMVSLPPDFSMFRDGAIVAVMYNWDKAVAESAGSTFGKGTPPGMFLFARNVGGLEFLISLRPQDHGAVYAWFASTNIWGTDGNDDGALFRQAGSFSAFMAGLTDTSDQRGLDDIGAQDLRDEGITVTIPDA